MTNNEKMFNALYPIIIALFILTAIMIIVLIVCYKKKKHIKASALALIISIILFALSNVAQSELQKKIIDEKFFDGQGMPIDSIIDGLKDTYGK